MEIFEAGRPSLLASLGRFMRKCIFRILSIGPIPSHVAFIMDGNRRFAKKEKLEEGSGHRAGSLALMSTLKYCYELGVKYVTIYAFSIDNFRRRPDEVQLIMDLILEKIEGLLRDENVVNAYGIRVRFVGTLKLLSEPVRVAAEKVARASAKNTKFVLVICIAYSSTDEIVHAVQESCKYKLNKIEPSNSNRACNDGNEQVEENGKKIDSTITHGVQESCKDETDKSRTINAKPMYNGVTKEAGGTDNANTVIVNSIGDKWDDAHELEATRTGNGVISVEEIDKMLSHSSIKLVDIEKKLHMAVAPDPDILVRTSGESRLSNFLLWQTSNCSLYSPKALWPEIGLRHLVWAVITFQRNHSYLEKKKKQL
ncbi:hypothetical protein P3X46_031429 [Hevea brasiliensis]|uniref:Alkyl transferase n=1 Tax=Hevea brasiliensis TaxID=3981 RepID=A0ABQ9KLM6_HEVBR|nr:dehydrodolichyl diphosphate synthase 6 [Hevea brasiliensis]KAJ9140832.1 hypothetical protein P3X46_031429 [Hevea brasiliensis]